MINNFEKEASESVNMAELANSLKRISAIEKILHNLCFQVQALEQAILDSSFSSFEILEGEARDSQKDLT